MFATAAAAALGVCVLFLLFGSSGWKGLASPALSRSGEGGLLPGELREEFLPDPDVPRPQEDPRRLRGRPLPPEVVKRLPRAKLARAGGWIASHSALQRARQADPERPPLWILQDAWRQARGPVVRQNLIFHAVLSVDPAESRAWLERVAAGGSREDALDAWAALAYAGDLGALARLEALAAEVGTAPLRRGLDDLSEHEMLGEGDAVEARTFLRAHRAWEALVRRPYFLRMGHYAAVRWTDRPPPPAAIRIRLLEAWLDLWPGHPGSDDVAVRIAREHVRQEHWYDAARWYSHAMVLPDQDAFDPAMKGLLGTVELFLDDAGLYALVRDAEGHDRNVTLLACMLQRRLAARGEMARALREVETWSSRHPESVVAAAWDARWSAPPSRGLSSGLSPLPSDDALRRREPAPATWPVPEGAPEGVVDWRHDYGHAFFQSPQRDRPLDPYPEAVLPSGVILAAQFRGWETLLELDRRIERARGRARADLLYKRAAVAYHDPKIVQPAWFYGRAKGGCFGGGELLSQVEEGAWDAAYARWNEAHARYEFGAHGEFLAVRTFRRMAQEHPDYPRLDKVVFSEAQALQRYMARINPADPLRTQVVTDIVNTLHRFRRDHRDSPLVPDATRALTYWDDILRRFLTAR
jgi:hypothetical protein